jgi:hypothetical protein
MAREDEMAESIEIGAGVDQAAEYPVVAHVRPATQGRNRLTTAFRFFLALPHLILVGGPVAIMVLAGSLREDSFPLGFGSGGAFGVLVGLFAVVAWFAIVFGGRHPEGLWKLAAFYLRWRVRAIAYMTLLRDEYPPFGDEEYPASLVLPAPGEPRDRLTVGFRVLLALPHILALWALSIAWAFTTAVAWVMILFTGRYPETLYGFALGVFAWAFRVEAYMLLLRDEYPPFTLRV